MPHGATPDAGKEEIKLDWNSIRKSRLFNLRRNVELIPLAGILGAVVTGVTAATIYSCYKLDIKFIKSGPPRWDNMIDLLNPKSKKLLTIQQEYKPMTELHAILSEMREEELKKEREAAAAKLEGEDSWC